MASIDGSGRSPGASGATDLDKVNKDTDVVDRKGKRPFAAALQKRRGSVERAVRSREKETGFTAKIDKEFRAKTKDMVRDMQARVADKQVRTGKTPSQAPAQAPGKPPRQSQRLQPSPHRPSEQPPQQQAATRASVKPPKPSRPDHFPPPPDEQRGAAQAKGGAKTLGRAGGRAGPAKPERSPHTMTSTTLPRPQAKPRTVLAEATARPTPAPRAPSEAPTPAPRTILPQQRATPQTGTTQTAAQGNYDTLTNVSIERRQGIQYSQPGDKHATPRLGPRPLGDDKFLQGGGFNPAATLKHPNVVENMRGLDASMRTPAPPRLSIATRMMNTLKAFFHVGTPTQQRVALSSHDRVYANLIEDRVDELGARKGALSSEKRSQFDRAESEINRNLRSVAQNVVGGSRRDAEFTNQVKQDVRNALDRMENLFKESPSSVPHEYETIAEIRARGDER